MENDEQRTKREGCEEALSRFFTSPLVESKRMGGVSIISGTHKGASGAISDLDCFW